MDSFLTLAMEIYSNKREMSTSSNGFSSGHVIHKKTRIAETGLSFLF